MRGVASHRVTEIGVAEGDSLDFALSLSTVACLHQFLIEFSDAAAPALQRNPR
jgi:hypothetical protein